MCDNCLFGLYGGHALCLIGFCFFRGPVMVVRIRQPRDLPNPGCSARSGSEGCVGKGKAQKQGSVGWPEEASE